MTEYQAKVKVEGRQGGYTARVVPVPETSTSPPPPWELHRGDSITVTLDWQAEPQDAFYEFIDVNISGPGHSIEGIKSSNGKRHEPNQTWGQSPGPGWWGGDKPTTVSSQKTNGWEEIYRIGGVQGEERTGAVIEDIEVLAPEEEDHYYFSGRVRVKTADGKLLSPPGLGVPFDPEMVNKGSGGRRRRR